VGQNLVGINRPKVPLPDVVRMQTRQPNLGIPVDRLAPLGPRSLANAARAHRGIGDRGLRNAPPPSAPKASGVPAGLKPELLRLGLERLL
jgi:hypothetical protein